MWDRSKCVLFVSYTTGWCLYIAHVIGMVHNIIQPVSIQPLKSTMATNRRLAHFFSVKQQSIPGDGNHLEETCPKNFQWKQPCPAPPPKKKRHMVIMIYEPNSRWKHLRPANFSQTNPWKSKAKPNVLTVGSGFSFLGISLPETNISPLKK